ncbi:LacI family DNA-binding transcriptional regulator [Spongiactinospora rosea]|uniref:LacI family DNA-binding transcriptional regulator n=1 Tax=Spongiactinospora rosea TaxID=2248750 RepID=UPI001314476E|nr:LacI family DNA-binding transcriptional regulator [Spongiactinospora rosea]
MRRPPGLAAVAERAGVSVSLVSRILTGDPGLRVRETTRQRVLRAAADLAYVPHVSGRALRLAEAGAIGLVVRDVGNPVHAEIIHGARLATAARGQALLLAAAPGPAAIDRLIGEGRVDGLLWLGCGLDDDLAVRAAAHLPTLLAGDRPRAGVPGVRLADERAVASAVAHLAALGHRDIGFIGGDAAADVSVRRLAGFVAALRERGLPVREEWIATGGWDAADGRAAMDALLARPARPTAVVVADVVMCLGALAAARERGVAVPAELSVVAVHDAWFAAHAAPPLTVVRLPLRDLGGRAAELIMSGDLDGPPGGHLIDGPPELVRRGSTAAPAPPVTG